jgi:hypothetical protein
MTLFLEHQNSPEIFIGVRVAQSSFLCNALLTIVCLLPFFLLVVVLSIILRTVACDNPFDIFQLFS